MNARARGWNYGPTGKRQHYWRCVGSDKGTLRFLSLCGLAMLLDGVAALVDGFPRLNSDCRTCARAFMAKPDLHPREASDD